MPFQLLLISPVLAPVWIAGLVRLFRDPRLRDYRFVAWAWVILAIVFMAAGGKPYYLAGLFPALLGAGSVSVDGWLEGGRRGLRRGLLAGAVALSAVIGGLVSLPILHARDAGPVVDVNGDVGETIGWPAFTRTVPGVYQGLQDRGRAVVFTSNYGEAGAVDRFGPDLGLPGASSEHNGYGYWGPPPEGSEPVIPIGLDRSELSHFRDRRPTARIDNGVGIDNDEQGTEIRLRRAARLLVERVGLAAPLGLSPAHAAAFSFGDVQGSFSRLVSSSASSAIAILSCLSESRSRSVTVSSSIVWWSTVTPQGVPISSWRR